MRSQDFGGLSDQGRQIMNFPSSCCTRLQTLPPLASTPVTPHPTGAPGTPCSQLPASKGVVTRCTQLVTLAPVPGSNAMNWLQPVNEARFVVGQ
jgi:hypothetical protein